MAAASGDGLVGVVLDVRNGFAAVQVRGFVEAEYTGTLALGWADLTGQGGRSAPGPGDTADCLVLRTGHCRQNRPRAPVVTGGKGKGGEYGLSF